MKNSSKLTRKQLALRLFALLLVINGSLMMMITPDATVETVETPLSADMIELRVKATLFTSFAARKQVLLTQEQGQRIGPVTLLRQEEEALVIALPSSLYRQHHHQLTQENWAVLPYLEGMLKQHSTSTGVSYEIAY